MNLNIDKIKLELPSRLEDICKFSFNFDNLMKVIDYLFSNNVIMVKEIRDLKTRVNDLDLLHSDIEKLKLKTSSIEKINDNINRSFIDMKERFIQNDSKVSEIIKKIKNFKVFSKKMKKF